MAKKRTLKITFDRDVSVFYKEDFKLFKKLTETIYNAKIIESEDGVSER